jgi:4-hydroxy-3-methylbut-2-enyl diphosphate reductase
MKIVVSTLSGFCSGVMRAIKGAEKALRENEKIYCLGEIIHNPDVVRSLKEQGMVLVDDISKVPNGSNFIVRSHGLQNKIIERALGKQLNIYDFTCPKVKKIHRLVTELTMERYYIFIIGNPGHPEVKAIVSLTRGNATVIRGIDDLKKHTISSQNAVVVQTTFNPITFLNIVQEIILQSKKTLVFNTLCEETIKRQKEALQIAGNVDYVVVVGGKNSSNTKTLYNIVKNSVPAVQIENAHELNKRQLKGLGRVGIISGASTPEEEVKKVYETIRRFDEDS